MKIILAACNAKYIHSNLAVYDLQAYARQYQQHILLKEYTINQQKDEIMKDLYEEKPDVICFSCYIWNISFVKELAEDLKKVLPSVPFWAGGPEVSFDAEAFLAANPAFDGVMVGEGEETFLELAGYYVDHRKSLEQIRGIAFRKENQVLHNGWREIMDLSKVPFPYKDLQDFDHRIIYYESSRGCPFSCSYCLSSVDKKLRFRSLDLVRKELQFFLDHKVPQVKFVDRTFNCKHDHAMAIWKYIVEHDNGVTNFHFEIAADLLREEELELMAAMRPGLIQLEIGVQSTNLQTLEAIHRKTDFSRICQIVERIHSFGNIHQHLDLIAGLPYEDYDSFHHSFNDVYALRPQQFQLGFLKVLKGSLMKQMEKEYGIVHKEKEPYEVLSTNWITYEDVLNLKKVENMVEVYYNSGQFENSLKYVETLFSDSFTMYEALGRFYEQKGYDCISHNRLRRYEILLEFIESLKQGDVQKGADALVLDLYLREKLKSRPSFAKDQKAEEKKIWAYRKQENIPKTAHIQVFWDGRVLLFDYEKKDPLTGNALTEEIRL
ncbi:B12-binding domain-containing radical SAM protein [Blautia sp. 1033sp1_1033st1_G9_1033SCRN_220408]|uniref:B12-binding domain-containing radical SAM protein n=1 Tax=Blautia sp. 1033sp1_1033st1_G9_1033SCRN_220408 TaxID=3144490 RepID=UPI0034A45332